MKNNTGMEQASAEFMAALLEPIKEHAADTPRRQEPASTTTIQHITINRPTRCTIVIGNGGPMSRPKK